VVVGDLIGSGVSQEQAIVGETPNLAARLQGVAEPNSVVIAESTRKLVGSLFEFGDLGARDLKGRTGPVRAWAALRPAAAESRFEALHATGMTDLVGREEELELLLRRWSKAKTGEGQVVLLSGEAGIGKSRLTAALRDRLVGKPHTQLRYFCSPQHKDSPLYPIIGQMQHAAGLRHEDSLQAKLDKLDAMLAQTRTPTENVALFAEMLSLENDGRYPALPLVPQQRREQTLTALVSQVELLERDCPVLMIFEDAHWSDPTSLEALGRGMDRITTLRVLMIVTFRPEFEAPWIGRPYVTAITINRLSKREIVDMIGRVVGNKFLPENLRQDIIERTDGIPLFVEEITKAVMEAESEGKARQSISVVPTPALNVPATLHASLMARLDRLGAAKEAAQIGAAIGREFSHNLLAAVACKPEKELALSLDRLTAAGLLFRNGIPPHANYVFKHVLIRDAAYGTLLRNRRQELHRQIVSVLEREFAELVVSQPELLAHHCSEAGMIAEAIEYCLLAAQRATAASNNTEKIAHIARGITLLEQLPSSDQRAADFRIRLTLGGAGFMW
jgi:predicted ATPase